ncbi:hypothetical protein C8Q73DRAFT_791489 [Cubamyces lactineus]|nr:hypothetical protein C8Q73DRAFT_791489 [Cubamyces lactineus]
MRFITSVSALAISSIALAQDITVHVGSSFGQQQYAFDPPAFNATKGSVITFIFDGSPGNHSVSQSESFVKPCQPLAGGFDSGFVNVPQGARAPFPTWNLTITDEAPIWFYCAQPGADALGPFHCEEGMVGAINAGAPLIFNTFQTIAMEVAFGDVGQPSPALLGINAFASAPPGPLGDIFSAAGAPTGTLHMSTASSGATTILSGSYSSSAITSQKSMMYQTPTGTTDRRPIGSHVPVGTIIGAVVGGVSAATVAVSILYVLRCRRRRRAGSKGYSHLWFLGSVHGRPSKVPDGNVDIEQVDEVAQVTTARYYDPDDPSTYPLPIPVILRGERYGAGPIQPAGIPGAYGYP